MDYTPRHSQPFTLKEATNLDVSVIVEGIPATHLAYQFESTDSAEISRLENSLRKLQETQQFLQSHLEATPDAEIAQVLDENNIVM